VHFEQHLPPQSLLHVLQHWVPQALQQQVEALLAAHALPHPPNQSYMPWSGPLSEDLPCSPAIAENVPMAKNATIANMNIFFTIAPPFFIELLYHVLAFEEANCS
jgi:hypothetical protein